MTVIHNKHCNKFESKGRWGRLTDEIKWKWQKEIEQFAVVFANGRRANFAICRASLAKSKEQTRAPARLPVLKGPIRGQTVRAKQAGRFPFFNCPTLKVTTITVSQKQHVINMKKYLINKYILNEIW